jgi:hypothetical protein
MPDSAAESQKHHLSKIRPHGEVNASYFTSVYARLLAFTGSYLKTAGLSLLGQVARLRHRGEQGGQRLAEVGADRRVIEEAGG